MCCLLIFILQIPDLLVEEPREPLNICLSNLLPEITPNYKPTPIILDSQLKKVYNDDEALSRVMSNKNQRYNLYFILFFVGTLYV